MNIIFFRSGFPVSSRVQSININSIYSRSNDDSIFIYVANKVHYIQIMLTCPLKQKMDLEKINLEYSI